MSTVTDTDFLIIGGGIAGISLAAKLAPHGRVTLWEAEDTLAYHSSSRSAAMYEPGYGPPAVQALTRASGAEFHASGTLSERGFMLIADHAAEHRFEQDLADLHLTEITHEDALQRVPTLNPDHLARAAVSAGAWDIDTDALIQAYLREARSHGAQIATRHPVQQIERQATAWRVTSGETQIRAGVLINAAGAWADQVAAMAGLGGISLQPKRRSMARIPAPEGYSVRHWPMVLGAGESFYFKPDAGALIVSPADADPVQPHDAFADDFVLAQGLALYEQAVTTPVTRMLANWAGLRSFTPDGTPAIGFDPVEPGFFWLAGQGGYGFQSAPAAARLAADLITGRDPTRWLEAATVRALDPARLARH